MSLTLYLLIAGEQFFVTQLKGREELGKPFQFKITIKNIKQKISQNCLGVTAHLCFQREDKTVREITGLIKQYDLDQNGHSVLFVPAIDLLKDQRQPHVFLNRTIIEIIQGLLLKKAHYATDQIRWNFKGDYPIKPFIMQPPQESDFDFLQRLIAKTGIFYYFDREDIIFCDHNNALPHRKDPIIYRTTYNHQTESTLTSPQIKRTRTPERFIIRDHNEDLPEIPIYAQSDVSTPYNTHHTYDIYGVGAATLEHAQKLSSLYAERAQIESFEIHTKTHTNDLFCGLCATLDFTHWLSKYSGDYIITTLEHYFDYSDSEKAVYTNHITLIPLAHPYRLPIPTHPKTPLTLNATIEPTETGTILDEAGRYHVRFHFDHDPTPLGHASLPVRRLHFYSGFPDPYENIPVGTHFPLTTGTTVLMGFWHGDPDRPFIIAALPDKNTLSATPHEQYNNIATPLGHELILDDNPTTQHIALQTPHQEMALRMISNPTEHTLSLTTTRGDMQLDSAQTQKQTTCGHCIETSHANRLSQIQGQQVTHVNGDILSCHAHQELCLKAIQNIELHSDQHIEMISGHHMTLHAQDKISFKNESAMWHSHKGQLTLAGSVSLHSQETIHISNGSAGIILHPTGLITVYGQTITGNLIYAGDVKHNPTPIACPQGPYAK